MKKYFILTSVLALTACATGGGSGGSISNYTSPMTDDMRVSSQAIESNGNITSMASEILVAKDGTKPSIVRSSTVTQDDIIYDAYHLDDVDFKAAVNSNSLDKLRFTIDANGRVNGMIFEDVNNDYGSYSSNIIFDSQLTRDNDTNEFNMETYHTSGEGAGQVAFKGNFEYKSYAKDKKLRFADFGIVEVTGEYNIDRNTKKDINMTIPFVGGYAVKNIAKDDIDGKLEFSGRAIGMVDGIGCQNGAGNGGCHINLQDDNAKLIFENGTEKLTADFNNWYKIDITKGSYGTSFVVDGSNKDIDSKYAISNSNDGKLDTMYYGDNNQATEATAIFQYVKQGNSSDMMDKKDDIDVSIGFGGKAQ